MPLCNLPKKVPIQILNPASVHWPRSSKGELPHGSLKPAGDCVNRLSQCKQKPGGRPSEGPGNQKPGHGKQKPGEVREGLAVEAPEGHLVRVGAQNSVIAAKSVGKSESLVGEERSVTLPSDDKDEDDKRSHALRNEEEEAEEEGQPEDCR